MSIPRKNQQYDLYRTTDELSRVLYEIMRVTLKEYTSYYEPAERDWDEEMVEKMAARAARFLRKEIP